MRRDPISYQDAVSTFKDVCLVPISGTRTEISRTTGALDNCKFTCEIALITYTRACFLVLSHMSRTPGAA